MENEKINEVKGRMDIDPNSPITQDIVDRSINVLYPNIDWKYMSAKDAALKTSIIIIVRRSLDVVFRDVKNYIIIPIIDVRNKTINVSIVKSHILDNDDLKHFPEETKDAMTRSLQQAVVEQIVVIQKLNSMKNNYTKPDLTNIDMDKLITNFPHHLSFMKENANTVIITDTYDNYYIAKNRGQYSLSNTFISKEEFMKLLDEEMTVLVIPIKRIYEYIPKKVEEPISYIEEDLSAEYASADVFVVDYGEGKYHVLKDRFGRNDHVVYEEEYQEIMKRQVRGVVFQGMTVKEKDLKKYLKDRK